MVAPAIAQALFATAVGLAAAIPAYIAYNKFSTDAGKFTAAWRASPTSSRRPPSSAGWPSGADVGAVALSLTTPPTGRRGRGRGRAAAALSEINVTPLVDVMLVLLIIFMISAPLLTVGVPLQLPKTEAGAMQDQNEPLTVSIRADGSIFLNQTETPFAALAPALRSTWPAPASRGRSMCAPTAARPTRSWPR